MKNLLNFLLSILTMLGLAILTYLILSGIGAIAAVIVRGFEVTYQLLK
jgi:hypothetical protein